MRALILFLLFFLIGCSIKKKSSDCRDLNRGIGLHSICKISQEFKSTGILDSISKYEFINSVVDRSNLEIQLWINMNSNYERNEIAVFVYNEKAYPIPILSNNYPHYWQFFEDSIDYEHALPNTTFLKEFKNMLTTLEIIDSNKIANAALNNLFNSILYSRIIHESDSVDIIEESEYMSNNMDSQDNCYGRNLRTLKNLYRNIHKSPGFIEYNAYWDYRHKRIYQIDMDSIRMSKKFNPCLKIYNLECNYTFFIL